MLSMRAKKSVTMLKREKKLTNSYRGFHGSLLLQNYLSRSSRKSTYMFQCCGPEFEFDVFLVNISESYSLSRVTRITVVVVSAAYWM